jgi:hypothetical protein
VVGAANPRICFAISCLSPSPVCTLLKSSTLISTAWVLAMNPLSGWENFYVIVGSSAGALIGLQFVVITLIANRPIGQGQSTSAGAFATPTVVHFGSVLLLSAVGCAPWHSLEGVEVLWGLLGLGGIVYEVVTVRRMTRTAYKPVFEDWLFHGLLPLAGYAALAVSAICSRLHAEGAVVGDVLFGVAAASLLLLFVGIHNAWDAVTYHIFSPPKREE